MFPNCGRVLAYPIKECVGGRCPFCGYTPGDVDVSADISPAREELFKLSEQVRQAIAQRLCADLALDEDDLRAMLRREIEDSIMEDRDGFLRESVIGTIKNEIYEEVTEKIQSECREFWREFYRTDEEFLSQLRRELRNEMRSDPVVLSEEELENLRLEIFKDLGLEIREEAFRELMAEMRSDPAVLARLQDELANRIYAEIKASLVARNDSPTEPPAA